MTDKEKKFDERYKRTNEVTDTECNYGKWCATCMHCINDTTWTGAGFEHSYCSNSRKDFRQP